MWVITQVSIDEFFHFWTFSPFFGSSTGSKSFFRSRVHSGSPGNRHYDIGPSFFSLRSFRRIIQGRAPQSVLTIHDELMHEFPYSRHRRPKNAIFVLDQVIYGFDMLRRSPQHKVEEPHAVSKRETLKFCTHVPWVVTQLWMNEFFVLPSPFSGSPTGSRCSPEKNWGRRKTVKKAKSEEGKLHLRKLQNDTQNMCAKL